MLVKFYCFRKSMLNPNTKESLKKNWSEIWLHGGRKCKRLVIQKYFFICLEGKRHFSNLRVIEFFMNYHANKETVPTIKRCFFIKFANPSCKIIHSMYCFPFFVKLFFVLHRRLCFQCLQPKYCGSLDLKAAKCS